MSRDHDFTKPADGSTTFGVLYRYLRSNFLALASHFWGPLDSAPSGLLGGMLFWRRTSGVDALKYYDGTIEKHLTDGLPEITAARGSAASLNARLGVALNADGTIKGDAPASDWWSSETGTVVRESDTSFSITGVDRSHIYTDRLALAVTDDSDSITYHYVSGDSVYSTDTTVTVTGTLPAAIALVEFGQPVPNAPSTVSEVTTADLDAVRNDLLAEALRRGIGDGTDGREYLGDGWQDTLADASGIDAAASSGYVHATADGGSVAPTPGTTSAGLDLAALAHSDVKGSITTLTVDTANAAGHFDAAKGASVLAGCRMVIGGADVVITGVTGDGTSSGSVTFDGTLAAGAHAVSGIYGTEISSGALRLSRYYADYTDDQCTGGTATASSESNSTHTASYAFDNNAGSAWVTAAGVTAAWIAYEFTASKTIRQYTLKAYDQYVTRNPTDWTFEGSNDGSTWDVLDTQSGQSFALSEMKTFQIDNEAAYTHYRVNITGNMGDTTITIAEIQMMEQTRVVPSGVTYTAQGSIDASSIASISSAAATADDVGQTLLFAMSFDGGATWQAHDGSAWQTVDRNSPDASWMTAAELAAASGYPSLTGDIYVALALATADASETPAVSAVTLTTVGQTANMDLLFSSFVATAPELARVAFVLHAVDDVTLDTDLIARVRRGTGDWIAADLEVESRFDDTAVLVVGDADLSAGSGTDTVLRLTSANHKEFDIRAVSCMFKEVA